MRGCCAWPCRPGARAACVAREYDMPTRAGQSAVRRLVLRATRALRRGFERIEALEEMSC